MTKQKLISAIILILVLFTMKMYSQDNSNIRMITWDSVGQNEIIKQGEVYNIVYENVSPENTRVKYTDNGDNTYQLELIYFDDLSVENNPFKYKYNQVIVNFDSLNEEHKLLSKKLIRAVESYPESENNFDEISEKVSKTPEFKNKALDMFLFDVNEKDVDNNNNKIKSITKDIKDNIDEYLLNDNKIKGLKTKIKYLLTHGGSEQELELIQNELDQLLARNGILKTKINNLNTQRDELIEDNKLKMAKLDYQSNLNILLIIVAIVIFIFLLFLYRAYRNKKKANKIIEEERGKSESLLHNILPKSIADRLKKSEVIADEFEDAGVIFIDLVDFTKISADVSPAKIVNVLNDVFTVCDQIADKHGIEKIKTIGDCYMAASGIPVMQEGHNIALANMAIDVMNYMKEYKAPDGTAIKFRIGLDSGPIVAGVIGKKKFIYDLWGDTVNTAFRMEEFGVINKIQCTDRFKDKLTGIENNGDFKFKDTGDIEIKGKGIMHTWFLNWEN